MIGKCEIAKAVHFEAAHYLVSGGADDSRRRLHGHSFRLEAAIARPLDPEKEWVEDFAILGAALEQVRTDLDHRLLNEIPGLEIPTLERICAFVAGRLAAVLPGLVWVSVARPSLGESCRLTLHGY